MGIDAQTDDSTEHLSSNTEAKPESQEAFLVVWCRTQDDQPFFTKSVVRVQPCCVRDHHKPEGQGVRCNDEIWVLFTSST
ncbi:hypothetical protein Pdw03_5976 [Penicillium digitatum]|uniref:Uncharacterized protein n=1 Tax=Penicillium digitatum TaxID=36651 RepID=A0A7T6XW24_PENDI|nr:hypothetical protein Pdw03_5976 [Penicillium digitatum]